MTTVLVALEKAGLEGHCRREQLGLGGLLSLSSIEKLGGGTLVDTEG